MIGNGDRADLAVCIRIDIDCLFLRILRVRLFCCQYRRCTKSSYAHHGSHAYCGISIQIFLYFNLSVSVHGLIPRFCY